MFFSKKSINSIFAYDLINEPNLTPITDTDALITEGFRKNIIVYRCVTLIAKSVASIAPIIKECGKEVTDHPAIKIFKTPNHLHSWTSFAESVISYLLLYGNSYIKPIYIENDGVPEEIYSLNPRNIEIKRLRNGHPSEYIYSANNKQLKIADDELIHLKFFNPFDELQGLSPLSAAIKSIDQHNAISNHNISILQNGGRPSGCLMVKNYTAPLSKEQREYLQKELRSSYQGTKNSGKILLLEGDFEWKEMGLSPKDMDFDTGKKLAAREIAEAFSIPPVLVGIEEDATFSNYKEARFHFWEDTVIPLAEYFFNELDKNILKKASKSLNLTYDNDNIQALVPRREAFWNQITNANFLTINEKRKALGYPPIDGGDQITYINKEN